MIRTASTSSTGRARRINQNFTKVFKSQNNIIMGIVYDGMGGHWSDNVASAMTIGHLGHNLGKTGFIDLGLTQRRLIMWLWLESETILDIADRFADLNRIGTTVALAIAFTEEILIARLGDSHYYLYGRNEFEQVARDHSLVHELVEMG